MKGRKLRIWPILVLIPIILVVAFALYRLSLHGKLKKRIEKIRAAGYPVTLQELDQWYELPPQGQNAADYITTAITYLKPPESEEAEVLPLFGRKKQLPPRTEAMEKETLARITQLIETNRTTIGLLEDAAKLKSCRYPIDLTLGPSTLVPNLSELRQMTFLLCLKAMMEAEQEQSDEAIDSLTCAMSLANSLKDEPLFISQLVRIGQHGVVLSATERIANRVQLKEPQLARVATMLSSAYDPNDLIRAVVSDQCMTLHVLRHPTESGLDLPAIVAPEGPSLLQIHLAQAAGQVDRYLIKCIDLVDEQIQAMHLPLGERLNAMTNIESQANQLRQNHKVLSYFMPTIYRAIEFDLQNMTSLRVASVGLTVQRYRLANGTLPETLEALVPDFLDTTPLDPFDGQPLRYKKLDPGFVVYSIGKDLSDDGGQERPSNNKRSDSPKNYDLTFIMER